MKQELLCVTIMAASDNASVFRDTKERSVEHPYSKAIKISCCLSPTSPETVPKVRVIRHDCLDLAQKLAAKGIKSTILNFAHNEVPGGPTAVKGNTQEEQIFRRTNACVSLKTDLYPIDCETKGPALLVSHTITVIKNREGKILTTPFEISLVSCAAIPFPSTRWEEKGVFFRHKADETLVEAKMRSIIAESPSDIVIVGAWGLGAFNGPIEGMCQSWRRALETCGGGKRIPKYVIFAVWSSDKEEREKLVKAFSCI